MRRGLAALALLLAPLLAPGGPARAAGFSEAAAPDPGRPDLVVGIWYPSDTPPIAQPLGPDMQAVARAAPLAGARLPLVLISHGSGGWYGSHADTARALADAGFVVAAVTHAGDNVADHAGAMDLAERPRQLGRVLNYMLDDWPLHARLDPTRVGVFGFSAGGFTALVALGGVPDLGRIPAHCGANPEEWLCAMLRDRGVDLENPSPPPAAEWRREPRLRAAVIAAPALGFAFGRPGLAAVAAPVQLWRAERDEVLPNPWHAQMVREDFPRPPDYHVAPNAGHFAFLAPCGPSLAAAAPDICADPPGFDRAAFHAAFNAEVARFFRAHL